HLDPVGVDPGIVDERLPDVGPDLLVRSALPLPAFVLGAVAVPRGAVALAAAPALRRELLRPRVSAPCPGAGLRPARRPRLRRPGPGRRRAARRGAVLVLAVPSPVAPAADVPLSPLELDLVGRVLPRPELAGLKRSAAPERSAGVAHP